MKKLLCLILASIMLFVTGCSSNSSSENNSQESVSDNGYLDIVTTIFPQYDFAKQITGGKCNLHMLLQPGSESHTYEPTPSDIIKIQNCDVFIYVGGENDVWVDEILSSMDVSKMTIIKMMDYVDIVEEETIEGMTEVEEEESDEKEYDEHIWTSPKNAKLLVTAICDKLCSIDTENADEFKANAAAYNEKITDLQGKITDIVSKAANKTIIFGDRFPFRYFADEFGLKYYAAFPGCGTDSEPSAATIAFLIDKVKAESIPVIYYLEFSSKKVADTLANETGAKTLLFHSCHNVTQDELDKGVSYVDLMTQNMENLKVGLAVQ